MRVIFDSGRAISIVPSCRVAPMHDRRHAVAVVGYEWRQQVSPRNGGVRYAWDEVESIVVVDDNHLPYLSVSATAGSPYSAQDIDAFIVALPEKVFYPADAVDKLEPALFKFGPLLGLPAKEDTILRYFITTGSALRRFVREHESEFDPKLVEAVMVCHSRNSSGSSSSQRRRSGLLDASRHARSSTPPRASEIPPHFGCSRPDHSAGLRPSEAKRPQRRSRPSTLGPRPWRV